MAGPGPTVQRRRLANELRRLREAAGMSIEQVAERLECSSSKISRIETARVSPTPRDVRDILQSYGISGQRLDELVQTAREARKRNWLYAEYRGLPNVTLADLEAAADSINMYSDQVVPGLMQTADYARTVLQAIRLDLKLHPDEIERRVDLRLERQQLLADGKGPTLWIVLDEAVLRRMVGGPEVMRSQLHRLTEIAAQSDVTIQVLPFRAGAHTGMDGSFTIISFREPADPDVVYIENATRDLYLEDTGAIRRYRELFDHLRATALDPSESLTFFVNAAKEL